MASHPRTTPQRPEDTAPALHLKHTEAQEGGSVASAETEPDALRPWPGAGRGSLAGSEGVNAADHRPAQPQARSAWHSTLYSVEYTVVFVSWGNKVPQTGGLKQRHLCSPSPGGQKSEISIPGPNQGVSRAELPPGDLGDEPSLPLPASSSLAHGHITPVSASIFTSSSQGNLPPSPSYIWTLPIGFWVYD